MHVKKIAERKFGGCGSKKAPATGKNQTKQIKPKIVRAHIPPKCAKTKNSISK